MPAYDDYFLMGLLSLFGDYNWHIFSKHVKKSQQNGNITISKITNESFVEDMANSAGVLCGAGFETPAEALFMNKKLMVIPMKSQYEHKYNAAALESMGLPVINNLLPSNYEAISNWLESEEKVKVNYQDQTKKIVRRIFEVRVQNMIQQNNRELILDVIKM